MSSNPPTHHHPSPHLTLLPHLIPHLPHSFPLLRLLQHHSPSPTLHTLATIPPSTPTTPAYPNHFAALTVDLSAGVDTGCWIFSTFESGRRSKSGQLDMQGWRARGNIMALLGEVRGVLLGRGDNGDEDEHDDGKREGRGRFLVIGTLNETLLGLIGGEEVWGLKGEEVLTRGGYSERARGWLERERERLKREGRERGEEGVVAGVTVPYMKWIITPETNTALLPAATAAEGEDMVIMPASISGTTDEGTTTIDDGGSEGQNSNNNNTNNNDRDGIIAINERTDSTSKQTPSTSTPARTHRPPLLPAGENYHFSKVRLEELQTVVRSTAIPRTEEKLAQLGNVGVRYQPPPSPSSSSPPSPSLPATATPTATPTITTNSQTTTTTAEIDSNHPAHKEENEDDEKGSLVAWAFLSQDGSLSSLYVSPSHRGQGLAKAVVRKLMQELLSDPLGMGFQMAPLSMGFLTKTLGGSFHAQLGDVGDGATGWVSADVAVSNEESKGVVRAVGGKEGWRVRWVSVDLGRVGVVGGGVG